MGAQTYLYNHCVSSLVFDYSGHGDSSRPGTIAHLNDDSVAAYAWYAAAQGPHARLCVLGHSRGNGPMLEALPRLTPRPACAVVGSAFTSLRELGQFQLRGMMRVMLYLSPDYWNNLQAIPRAGVPLLVVYSDTDTVIPPAMGQQLFDAARPPKELIVARGFKHNAAYANPIDGWWEPVLRFAHGTPSGAASAQVH